MSVTPEHCNIPPGPNLQWAAFLKKKEEEEAALCSCLSLPHWYLED